MELHQLHCFLAVVEEGGFNRATTRLHITQPALSYQIKRLEEELGVSLFHRHPRGINPTEAGRVLLQNAQEIIESVRRARRAVEIRSKGVAGEIRIGTVESVGVYILPDVLRKIKEKYPMSRPTVMYRQAGEILDALLSNQVDLAVIANPRLDRRFNFETILEERISLVCSKTHPFFGRSTAKPSELRGLQFISLTPETPTGQLIRDHLARLGVSVDVVVTTPSVGTVKKMVEVGLGVAFLPDMVTREDLLCSGKPLNQLARIEVRPPLTRRIMLVTWKKIQCSPVIQAFLDDLRLYGLNWKGCVEPSGSR
ncbi:MAG: LysR family transcriptional regulator [Candidatus Deferrimicrobium sp.]